MALLTSGRLLDIRCSLTTSRHSTHWNVCFKPAGVLPGLGNTHRQLRCSRKHCRVQALLPGVGEAVQAVYGAVSHVPLADLHTHTVNLVASLADSSVVQSASDVVQSVSDSVTQVVSDPSVQEAAKAAGKDGGWLGPLASAFETVLKVLDSTLEGAGVPYSYGFAIILLTILVKAATFPLTKKQVESTNAVQALQPKVKALQARYANDQQQLQTEIALLYKQAGVNPLAGCLPTLATLPVWIGLYRALSNVADEGLLTAGWFWIPSLSGPTSIAARQSGGGFSWLLPFRDGAPPIGWHDALCYLVLPVLLVISQYVSQKIISPQPADDNPQAANTNAILKFLPLMIGYFSLNVPSGLTLYWFTNNILTTAQQVWLKRTPVPVGGGASPQMTPPGATATLVREEAKDTAKRVTGKDTSARRSPDQQPAAPQQQQQPSSRKSNRGAKFRALKAKEAARKAAQLSGQDGQAAETQQQQQHSPVVSTEEKPKVPDAAPAKSSASSNGSQSST